MSFSLSFHSSRHAARLPLAALVALCLSAPALAAEPAAKPATAARPKPDPQAKADPKPKADKATKTPSLSAAEVVKKNVSARGGTQAWKSIQALTVSGKMEAGSGDSVARSEAMVRSDPASRKARKDLKGGVQNASVEKQVQLPFRLSQQRPNRSRLEIDFAGATAVQVYDGKNGWKVRPFLNRKEVEPFTTEETKAEAESSELDGLLVGYQAKGSRVESEGVEKVEGRDAYKLKVTSRTGTVRRVWVDARTFLDVKVEGNPRRLDGKMHKVYVYQRDFRTVQGVKIPHVLETVVDGFPQSHKIFFERVAVNPKLDPAAFAKPKA